jgi:hypothetical protein
MNIDAMTFRAIAEAVLGEAMLTGRAAALTGREARAIVQLTYLASGADLEDSSEEETLREQLGRHICALAEISFDSVPWPSPLPIDGEERVAWLTTLGGELTARGPRELAYVIAYLLAIGDMELAPAESDFVSDLQDLLGISDTRASELVARAAEQVTPMQDLEGGSESQFYAR